MYTSVHACITITDCINYNVSYEIFNNTLQIVTIYHQNIISTLCMLKYLFLKFSTVHNNNSYDNTK